MNDNGGSVLGEVIATIIARVVKRLRPASDGFVPAVILVLMAVACTADSLLRHGTLLNLLPGAVVAVAIVGAFLLISQSLNAVAEPGDAEHAPAAAKPATRVDPGQTYHSKQAKLQTAGKTNRLR